MRMQSGLCSLGEGERSNPACVLTNGDCQVPVELLHTRRSKLVSRDRSTSTRSFESMPNKVAHVEDLEDPPAARSFQEREGRSSK